MAEVETHRRIIAPTECDILGHLNVARYFDAVSDGGFAMQSRYGLNHRDIMQGRRLSFVVVQSEDRFIAEVVAGEEVYLKSGLLEIGNKSALYRHRLFKAEDDALAFETLFRVVLMDLRARRSTVIPADVRAKMQDYLIEAA